MRHERLVESRPTPVAMTASEAAALRHAGRRLASDRAWWGEEAPSADASVIDCVPVSDERWLVTVRDAIGIVAVEPSLQLTVLPKIPVPHLLFLAERAGYLPRLDAHRASTARAVSLWDLMAEWFVALMERLMRRDLLRDYEEVGEEVTMARGRLRAGETATAFYCGRPAMVCDFDEFGLDTPLNRVLRAAAAIVVGNRYLRPALRAAARRLLWRMDEVGALRPNDLRVGTDRRSAHYADALLLAKHIVEGSGRSLMSGIDPVWTFLIRTPELVECGVRRVLDGCTSVRVVKRGIRLANSPLTLNPDLVIEAGSAVVAVGDVKYKLVSKDWRRGDLYQVVAFAAGFRVHQAVICEFAVGDETPRPPLAVGHTDVHHVVWVADAEHEPLASADHLVRQVDTWGARAAQLALPDPAA